MPDSSTASPLRHIPQVERLLASEAFAPLLNAHPRRWVLDEIRTRLDELRRAGRQGELDAGALTAEAIGEVLSHRLASRQRPDGRRVVNGTGVVLHTGLGRACLPKAAVDALGALSSRPQRVEIDLESGQRGGRGRGCENLLLQLTGGEAAAVVNNNAAATLLILAALARGKGVLLSRGEMVEIGGSYRVPEILRESGAQLVEVGTTNRTHARDYRQPLEADREIGEIGMLLKVHTSNYRVVGFTREVSLAELAALGKEHGVPMVYDMGSGSLLDLGHHGLPEEPTVASALTEGADLVCFSGDKLLGGPQAGLIVGRRELVERCRRHPLFRAMRPGRLIYTALEATLRLYIESEETVLREVPTLRALGAAPSDLRDRARRSASRLAKLEHIEVTAMACESEAGSGALPARGLGSWALRVRPGDASSRSLVELAAELRWGEPAILARLHEGALWLDLRTLDDNDLRHVESRLQELDSKDP